MAHTWGGCQKKMMANSSSPGAPMLPLTAASAISGETAPAAPPMTAL
jgi:hypothetical protein